jgi:beta-lactamase regulating signal transducer with metallopeptidase domain
MSPVELLAHPAGRLLTLALLHFLWQGLAVAGVLVLVVDLGGVRRAAARYACSLASLGAMVACPLATIIWLSGNRNAPAPVFHFPLTAQESPAELGFFGPLLVQLQPLQPLALAAWLAGVTFLGGRLLAGAIGLAHLRRGRMPLPLELAGIVQQLGERIQMDALPLVFLSRQVAEAMAVGIVRPLVLIPASWATEIPLEMLEAVIAHELAHLRRRDLWVNLLQRIVETLLFYHPAVWWLSRRMRIERELCADELAVAATGRRLEYARALEQVAHRRRADVRPALAAFLRGELKMRLLERVRNVLGLAAGERSRLWPAGLVALALPLGLWLASLAVSVAVADDDDKRDKPAAEKKRVEIQVKNRDGEERVKVQRDGEERKVETRDGDKPRRVELRLSRDGDRREEPRTDDDRKDRPKEGEVRKRPIKDEPKEEIVERKIITKKGEPISEDIVVKRVGGEAGRIEELSAIVKRLSAQVERLQDEVSALRGGKDESGSPKPKVRAPLKELKEKTSADEPKPKARVLLKEKPSADESSENEARARKERQAAEQRAKESAERDGKSKEESARVLKEAVERKLGAALKDANSKEAAALKKAVEKIEAEKREIEAEKREIEKRERQ